MAKTWTVQGKLQVGNLPNSIGGNAVKPLAGVTVKIYANEGIRWNSWGTTVTRSDGTFYLSKRKDKSKRKFRIEVQFKNKDLVIYGDNDTILATALKALAPLQRISVTNTAAIEGVLDHVSRATFKSNWYRILDTRTRSDFNGTRRLDRTITFRTNTDRRFANSLAHKHAIIWYTSNKLIRHLAGHGVPFAKKVAIKYPHNNKLIPDAVETAYASPINYCAYLVKNSNKDNFSNNSVDTLLHELMHLWAYRYSRGEGGMAWQLLIHQSTHNGLQAKEFVAFHEAFADFSSKFIAAHMFRGTTYSNKPFSKEYLRNLGITGLSNIDNHEEGWTHIFNCLTNGKLGTYNFNVASDEATFSSTTISVPTPKLTVYELMELFYTPSQLRTREMNLNTILSRIKATDEEFTDDIIQKFKAIFDVTSEDNFPSARAIKIRPVRGPIVRKV